MRPWLIGSAAAALLLAWVAVAAPSHVMAAPPPLRVLVVTGGHDYPTSFYTVFEQDGIAWDHATSLEAAFKDNPKPHYDVVVLYNMALQPAEAVQKNVQAYLEQGGGLLVLHHGILNFEESDWFRDVVGGRYLLNPKDGTAGIQLPARSRPGRQRRDDASDYTRCLADADSRRNLQGYVDRKDQHGAARNEERHE